MSWTTDNRWSPGASGAEVPDTARAVYSARWIDMGNDRPADVLGDRQGFAYNHTSHRDALIGLMTDNPCIRMLGTQPHEAVVCTNHGTTWTICTRRSGGYVYVDAWLS